MTYQIYYFLFCASSTIFLTLIPIYYVNSGFNEAQIGVLAAIFTFASITQPLIGIYAERKVGIKRMLLLSFILIATSLFLLFFTSSFIPVFALVLVYATFISPATGFTDNIVAEYITKHNKNYGNYKIFSTLGWGLGVILCTPIIYLFGFNSFLIFASLITIIMIFLLKYIEVPNYHNTEKKHLISDLKILFTNKNFIILLMFSSIFFGTYRLRGYYQSILMSSVTDQEIYIALLAVAMMIPELIVLPHFTKIEKKFSVKFRMLLSVMIASLMMLIFTFSASPIAILIGASLHGVVCAIYYPSILFETRRIVDPKITFTAILITSTLVGIVTSITALLIATPIFINYGINYIFFGILICMLVSLIPLAFMKSDK